MLMIWGKSFWSQECLEMQPSKTILHRLNISTLGVISKLKCYDMPVDGMCSHLDMHGNSILWILVLVCPSVLCHTNCQRPPGLSNIQYIAEHSAQGIECTTPFTSIIPSLPFAFMRDFLRVSLEVKTVCTPSGLHALLIFVPKKRQSHDRLEIQPLFREDILS